MRYSERRYQYNVIGLYIHHLRDAGRDAWRHFIKRDVLYIIIDAYYRNFRFKPRFIYQRAFCFITEYYRMIGYYTYIFFALLFMGSAILTPFVNTLNRFSLGKKNPHLSPLKMNRVG